MTDFPIAPNLPLHTAQREARALADSLVIIDALEKVEGAYPKRTIGLYLREAQELHASLGKRIAALTTAAAIRDGLSQQPEPGKGKSEAA